MYKTAHLVVVVVWVAPNLTSGDGHGVVVGVDHGGKVLGVDVVPVFGVVLGAEAVVVDVGGRVAIFVVVVVVVVVVVGFGKLVQALRVVLLHGHLDRVGRVVLLLLLLLLHLRTFCRRIERRLLDRVYFRAAEHAPVFLLPQLTKVERFHPRRRVLPTKLQLSPYRQKVSVGLGERARVAILLALLHRFKVSAWRQLLVVVVERFQPLVHVGGRLHRKTNGKPNFRLLALKHSVFVLVDGHREIVCLPPSVDHRVLLLFEKVVNILAVVREVALPLYIHFPVGHPDVLGSRARVTCTGHVLALGPPLSRQRRCREVRLFRRDLVVV